VPESFVTLVGDVTEYVRKRYAVGAAYEPWVQGGAEGFAKLKGICGVAVRREENSA
jgi:hypothetical protein